jgi:hypothetical protein
MKTRPGYACIRIDGPMSETHNFTCQFIIIYYLLLFIITERSEAIKNNHYQNEQFFSVLQYFVKIFFFTFFLGLPINIMYFLCRYEISLRVR